MSYSHSIVLSDRSTSSNIILSNSSKSFSNIISKSLSISFAVGRLISPTPSNFVFNLLFSNRNLFNSDNIIFTYYAPKRFERYLKINPKTRFLTIEKTDRFKYQDKPEVILANVKKGETASILILQSVSFIPQDKIKTAQEMNIPEMFITFSKIKHGLISALKQDFTDYKVENKGEWILITAKKYK